MMLSPGVISCSGLIGSGSGVTPMVIELTPGLQAADRRGHGLRCSGGAQHDSDPAEVVQRFGDVAVGGVDVVMCAQLDRIVLFGGAAVDRDGLETHCSGELDPEVAETADAEDRHPITRATRWYGAARCRSSRRRSPSERPPRRRAPRGSRASAVAGTVTDSA